MCGKLKTRFQKFLASLIKASDKMFSPFGSFQKSVCDVRNRADSMDRHRSLKSVNYETTHQCSPHDANQRNFRAINKRTRVRYQIRLVSHITRVVMQKRRSGGFSILVSRKSLDQRSLMEKGKFRALKRQICLSHQNWAGTQLFKLM